MKTNCYLCSIMNFVKSTVILSSFLLSWSSAFAGTIEDARSLMECFDYESALSLIEAELTLKQKASVAAQLNLLAGECCYALNRHEQAITYFNNAKARQPEAYRFLGKIGFLNYEFEGALENYETYKTKMKAVKKECNDDVENEIGRIQTAEGMLDRVEKIVVIDSIAVGREGFFKHYKLAHSSGSLKDINQLPIPIGETYPDLPFYSNESGEFIMWAQPDTTGTLRLMESTMLNDGTWQHPVMTDNILNEGGDANYPFMMSDGCTLYFANTGENSIGGYDIFRSNRDSETHEYMAPQNIGMPYNSPYNDYMLAIDEETGVGWWATDRNILSDDLITIYVFIPNEIRTNHSTDDEFIVEYAKISDYKSTWKEGFDYSDILNSINNITEATPKKKAEFYFPIGNGITYENYEDFRTHEGEQLMHQFQEKKTDYVDLLKELNKLRVLYHKSASASLAEEIKMMEQDVKHLHVTLSEIRNNIYKAEKQ